LLCYSYLLKNIICDYEENYSLFSLYSLTFPHFSDFQIMGEFSSSDDELENLERRNRRLLSDPSPLRMDFINLYRLGLCDCLALSSLPGCRFRDVQRNLHEDLRTIAARGITDVMVLMQPQEFRKYRVPALLEEYSKLGLKVHHFNMEDGNIPSYHQLFTSIETVKSVIASGGRLLIHCYGGLGRTCLVVATFLMSIDPNMSPEYVITLLREKRGPRAVQTVRQYNLIMEFRIIEETYFGQISRSRSVSR